MGAWRWIGRGAAGLLVLAAGAAAWDMATYDAKAWGADFERLKRDMAQGYANLDWIAEKRRLDLKALAEATAADIASAHSRVRAYRALERFVAAFNDPHLVLESRTQAPAAPAAGAGEAPEPMAGKDCAATGYEQGDPSFAFPFAAMPGWRPIGDGGSFPIGMAGKVGVLRIAAFGENRYLAACDAAYRPGMTERALQLATRARLQAELKARIAALKREGAERLLIDISGNGGGSEWVEEVTGLFSATPLVRAAPRRVGPACDRAGIWAGRKVCPVLAPAGDPMRIEGAGAWTGPLFVLADGGTASAAEDLAAWLHENGRARLVGARTYGAGCGYVDGGTVTRFSASPFQVKMPNCARFLKDGTNEIEGIAPDVALPMDKPEQAAAALARLLGR